MKFQSAFYSTVRSLMKLNATVTSRFPAGSTLLTAKRCMVFPMLHENKVNKQFLPGAGK
jgi:hypothetical protein